MLSQFRNTLHDFVKLYERRPISFVEFEHEVQNVAQIVRELFSQFGNTSCDQFLSIIFR